MTASDPVTDRREAYATLATVADTLVRVARTREDIDPETDYPETVTDAVLIVGTQWIDNNGNRSGRVFVFPHNGSAPPYITKGLLQEALDGPIRGSQ
jgi:hypothetical protein